jgi:hypothetical protein
VVLRTTTVDRAPTAYAAGGGALALAGLLLCTSGGIVSAGLAAGSDGLGCGVCTFMIGAASITLGLRLVGASR